MQLLLCLLLITAGEAAYIGYNIQQQTSGGFQRQIADWQNTFETLQGKNKQLTDTQNYLRKSISTTEVQIEMLTDQLKGIPGSGPASVQIIGRPGPNMPAAPTETAPAPVAGDNIGTVTTVSGQTFENCQLLKVEPDGITFNHTQGITKVLYPDLTLDLQKRFHVDPQSTAATEAANIRYQEQLQQAGATAGGNQPVTQ